MDKQQLFENIKRKKSFLCVGLDTDIKKIPEHLLKEEDPIFAFNKAIIDATADLCIAYKPNLAFYESMGVKGWIAFEKTVKYIKENYPDQFIIADAKRGDIGNTSAMYFSVQLPRQCLVVGNNQRRLIQRLNDICHRKGLSRTGHTQQCFKLVAFFESFD